MSEIKLAQSNYIRFKLKSDIAPSLILRQEPTGWKEDELEIVRHKQYHGIFTQFTNSLIFTEEAKDYIDNNFKVQGLNGNLYLTKERLQAVDNEIKWVEEYRGLADYNTRKIKNGGLNIRFNSNELEELIKTHESDEFELERIDSIDDVGISILKKYKTSIKGRTLTAQGRSDAIEITFQNGWHIRGKREGTLLTKIISQGPARHSSVDVAEWPGNTSGELPNNMFFVDTVAAGEVININCKITCNYESYSVLGNIINVYLRRLKWDGVANYSLQEEILVYTSTNNGVHYFEYEFNNTELPYDEGYALVFKKQNNNPVMFIKPYGEGLNIYINTSEYYEPSRDLSFIFVHDAFSRLMEILTGEKNRFKSNVFGKIDETGKYLSDGEFGKIGLISGLWARAFDESSELYKSMKLSLKNLRESTKTVFNVGFGIELENFKQILRVEKQEYFYQDRVIVKLPIQVNNVEEETDKDMYWSGIELGYTHGGEYENELGLDEPNTKTSWITPLRKTKNKYNYTSVIRADEYGLEIIRRKPELFYPTEDTQQDDHNWFLDLKEEEQLGVPTGTYEQVDWQDRLESEPQGILSPETFRSFLFTPLRILFRHGWIIRNGLEQAVNLVKNIKYISAKANSNLSMQFIDETQAYKENEDFKVNNLQRSKLSPNKIKFEHPITDELMNQILGTTEIEINGVIEKVPNYYFKMEWIQDGVVKRGYLLSLKPKGSGKFEMQEANEQIIRL